MEKIKENSQITYNNENFTFNDNSVGFQTVTIPQNILDIVLKYNAKLENEVEELKRKLVGK